jgi:hypothetical protein
MVNNDPFLSEISGGSGELSEDLVKPVIEPVVQASMDCADDFRKTTG